GRHTRCSRDWSSDVCSSDLPTLSLSGSDLGELSSLATALGLAESNGSFRDDWLSRPGHYLGRALADETQRDALIAFIDDVLGGRSEERRVGKGDGAEMAPRP